MSIQSREPCSRSAAYYRLCFWIFERIRITQSEKQKLLNLMGQDLSVKGEGECRIRLRNLSIVRQETGKRNRYQGCFRIEIGKAHV